MTPSISERATGNLQRSLVQDVPEGERSTLEKFRLVAIQYADADTAASLMEELKTTTLEKMKTNVIAASGTGMAENKAERIVKSGDEWTAYIRDMVTMRGKATKLKLQIEYLRMLDRREEREAWTARAEMKLR